MRLATFDDFRIGVVEDNRLIDVTGALPELLVEWPQLRVTWLIRHWDSLHERVSDSVARGKSVPVESVRLGAPVPAPPHVFALPANFRAHVGELNDRVVTKAGRTAREQGFFLKAPASIVGPDAAIELPRASTRRFDHECELAVIIGKHARDVTRERAHDVVFGYSGLIDLTMRIEKETFEEERSMRKSFAGFTPMGPVLVTADEIADETALRSRLLINGETRQSASLGDMIVGVAEAIELVSSVVALQPGDVIAMGTPEGVGPVSPGDDMTIEIDQIGSMHIQVRERSTVAPRPF